MSLLLIDESFGDLLKEAYREALTRHNDARRAYIASPQSGKGALLAVMQEAAANLAAVKKLAAAYRDATLSTVEVGDGEGELEALLS